MPDKTPRATERAPHPDPSNRKQSQGLLDEKDLKKVTGGAPTVSDITITKTSNKGTP